MSDAYRAAGVNLELGDELSEMLSNASEQTWQNRTGRYGEVTSEQDSFFGVRALSIKPLLEAPEPERLVTHLFDDGVGTKVEVAQRVGDHSTIAFDLFAMVSEDAALKGYEPIAISTTLDVRMLHESMRKQLQQLCVGYIAAAKAADVTVVNGEVAELGRLVGGFSGARLGDRVMNLLGRNKKLNYNWNATLLAAAHADRLLDGTAVQAGDTLVGFREQGFRSNGLSLARKQLLKSYGRNWHEKTLGGLERNQTFGEMVLKASTIYTPTFVQAIGGYDLRNEPQATVHAAAHITGGGIPGKLGRVLAPSGLGADIEDPFTPPVIMNILQERAGIADEEIYRVWNMGIGAIAITPEPDDLIALSIANGQWAKKIGTITDDHVIAIRSAGAASPGKKINFELHKK